MHMVTYIYTYVCIFIIMYICVYMHMYYIYMYIYTYLHILCVLDPITSRGIPVSLPWLNSNTLLPRGRGLDVIGGAAIQQQRHL